MVHSLPARTGAAGPTRKEPLGTALLLPPRPLPPLLAALLLAGCAAPDPLPALLEPLEEEFTPRPANVERAVPPEPLPPGWNWPEPVPAVYYGTEPRTPYVRHQPPGEGPGGTPAERSAANDDSGAWLRLGVWGFRGRLEGDARAAPSEIGMDASAIPGWYVEFGAAFDDEYELGILVEHFGDSQSEHVAGGTARTDGNLTGAWIFAGVLGDRLPDRWSLPREHAVRIDAMIGIRAAHVEAEVPDGAGGTYGREGSWTEFAFGVRAEVALHPRVFLSVRGDVGVEHDFFGSGDESEVDATIDTTSNSQSWQFIAGVRVRVLDHLSLIGGWRYVLLDGYEIVDDGRNEIRTASASWAGPWLGIEMDF